MDVATFLSAVRNKNNRKQIIDFPQEALKDHCMKLCFIWTLSGEEHAHTEYQVLVIDKMRLKHWELNLASTNLVQALRVEIGHNKAFWSIEGLSVFSWTRNLGHKLYFRLLLDMITIALKLKSVNTIFICFQEIKHTWALGIGYWALGKSMNTKPFI